MTNVRCILHFTSSISSEDLSMQYLLYIKHIPLGKQRKIVTYIKPQRHKNAESSLLFLYDLPKRRNVNYYYVAYSVSFKNVTFINSVCCKEMIFQIYKYCWMILVFIIK